MSKDAESFEFVLEDDKEIAFMGACMRLIATRRAVKKRRAEIVPPIPPTRMSHIQKVCHEEIVKSMEMAMNQMYERATFASNDAVSRVRSSKKMRVAYGPPAVVNVDFS